MARTAPSADTIPLAMAILTVGTVLGGLLVGIEPIGGDADQMYRPIKTELAKALRAGSLPFWSDRFGLGVPLLAESHAAALYPLNLVFYRVLDMARAYRWSMWLHHLALVAATYGYARCLGIGPWGSALAGLAFTLCGFLAIHATHEPFYHILPYLLAVLIVTERYLATGRWLWIVLLALVFGVELTLGHFQLQAWTAGLVLLLGFWRVVIDSRPSGTGIPACSADTPTGPAEGEDRGDRQEYLSPSGNGRISGWLRMLGLAGALVWGGAIAGVQLAASWELFQVSRATQRPATDLMFFGYPPAHWAELALPRLFRGLREGPEDRYWMEMGTTAYEACLYVGTIPLIFAFVGAFGVRRDRPLAPWRWIVPLSFAMATVPAWGRWFYESFVHLPVLGQFRAPARYTALTSLGLCLLAGRGVDQAIEERRFRAAILGASFFGLAAMGWGWFWTSRPILRPRGGPESFGAALAMAAPTWVLGLALVLAWRRGLLGTRWLVLMTAIELGALYYTGITVWDRSVNLSERSPVLRTLAADPTTQRVAGFLHDLPVLVGKIPTYPYIGFTLLSPNPLLESSQSWERLIDPSYLRWVRRLGTTHGVWDGPFDRFLRRDGQLPRAPDGTIKIAGGKVIYWGPDPALDRVVPFPQAGRRRQIWVVVRYFAPFPPARVATETRAASDEADLLRQVGEADAPDVVWYLPGDRPPDRGPPRARKARVVRWDGTSGEVAHDGTCDLVLNRTYYPGWQARLGDGTIVPIARAEGGIQAVRLEGAGVSRVSVRYRPCWLWPAAVVALVALAAALGALMGEWLGRTVMSG